MTAPHRSYILAHPDPGSAIRATPPPLPRRKSAADPGRSSQWRDDVSFPSEDEKRDTPAGVEAARREESSEKVRMDMEELEPSVPEERILHLAILFPDDASISRISEGEVRTARHFPSGLHATAPPPPLLSSSNDPHLIFLFNFPSSRPYSRRNNLPVSALDARAYKYSTPPVEPHVTACNLCPLPLPPFFFLLADIDTEWTTTPLRRSHTSAV
mmetsp:Transcript_28840/g.85146  ORF Transcript_28840/g.85146 Transcript_28840/m.85146 type:complete len:214 (-) Transcript_28840:546-1187(-)